MQSEYAIALKELTRRFGSFTAVDRLSFNVSKGSIFGFLGPNGSGKTTAIRMLCGLLQPTSGVAYVNGYDIRTDTEGVKRSIGYMNQSFSLYRDLTVNENLNFFGSIYGLKGTQLTQRKDRVIHLTGLEPYLERESGNLSGGWKQRLAISVSMIHDPDIIFLDEPTSGVDPVARRDLWDLLFDLAGDGKTLFVTTHYMDEAERCNHIAYIFLSKLIALGTPMELKALPEVTPEGTHRISVVVEYPPAALAVIKKLPFVLDATMVESELHILLPSDHGDEEVGEALRESGFGKCSVRDIEPSLEDVFVSITRRLASKS